MKTHILKPIDIELTTKELHNIFFASCCSYFEEIEDYDSLKKKHANNKGKGVGKTYFAIWEILKERKQGDFSINIIEGRN